MIALDSNVIIRLLVADDAVQGERARKLISENEVLIATTVLLECEWVLRTFNYPHSSAPISTPIWMSVNRARPRHMTMFPGGGSLALARYPPRRASFVR